MRSWVRPGEKGDRSLWETVMKKNFLMNNMSLMTKTFHSKRKEYTRDSGCILCGWQCAKNNGTWFLSLRLTALREQPCSRRWACSGQQVLNSGAYSRRPRKQVLPKTILNLKPQAPGSSLNSVISLKSGDFLRRSLLFSGLRSLLYINNQVGIGDIRKWPKAILLQSGFMPTSCVVVK